MSISQYIKGTKERGLVLIPLNNGGVLLSWFIFSELWGHDDPKDPLCAKISAGFVVTF